MYRAFSFLFSFVIVLLLSSCLSSRRAPSTDYRRIKKPDSREIPATENVNKEVKKENKKVDTRKYNSKLGIELTGDENPKLIEEVSKWLGTPYKTGGCSLSGTDCSCLIHTLYQSVYNIDLERSSDAMALKNCERIDKDDLKEGDLIFFSIKNVKISHVGLYLGNGYFVHSSTSKGVIISNLSEVYYRKYYTHSGRVYGMNRY
jgi:cell wall-associated NlpC family hydrolase